MIDTCVQHQSVGGLVAIPRIATKERYKAFYRYSGICSDVRFGAHRNSLNNLSRAVAERVLFVPDGFGGLKTPPKPLSRGYIRNVLRPFRRLIEEQVFTDSSFPIHPLSDDAFVSLYSGSKKKRYSAACDSLVRSPVIPRDANITAFVKVEKINFSAKSDPCPRVIQPRSFRYGAALGKHIKHVEKPLFKLIDNVFGGPTILKGYDCIGMATALKGMWDEFQDPVAIGLDASRFDQHCSQEMLEWEHDIWKILVADKSGVSSLLRLQLSNIGRGYMDDGLLKYSVSGCRMSGDMNTSSGNCLLMCAMVWSYLQGKNLSHFRLANNGDDCVVIIEKRYLGCLSDLQPWFVKMGYTMKVEDPVYDFEKIQFCQTSPVFDGVGYRMSRDPRVSLAKDLTSTLDLSNFRTRSLWLDAMRKGGLSLTTGLPIFGPFYEMFPLTHIQRRVNETTLNDVYSSGLYRLCPNRPAKPRPVTDESRYSFWLSFGILPDHQILIEKRFQTMNLQRCEYSTRQDYSELSILVEN